MIFAQEKSLIDDTLSPYKDDTILCSKVKNQCGKMTHGRGERSSQTDESDTTKMFSRVSKNLHQITKHSVLFIAKENQRSYWD